MNTQKWQRFERFHCNNSTKNNKHQTQSISSYLSGKNKFTLDPKLKDHPPISAEFAEFH